MLTNAHRACSMLIMSNFQMNTLHILIYGTYEYQHITDKYHVLDVRSIERESEREREQCTWIAQ